MNRKPGNIILFLSFLRLGMTAFGGPAMIAYIKEMSLKRNKWLDEESFKDGVVLCQSIPGATAMQMAAYVGLKSKDVTGALSAYTGFGLPAFVLMLILSMLYATSHNMPKVVSLFNGLQVVVVSIIANATYSFGKDMFKNYRNIFIALISAILLWSGINPFAVIIGASFLGIGFLKNTSFTSISTAGLSRMDPALKKITLLFLFFPLGLLGLYLTNKNLFTLATLMLKIDLFAFGGGFSSVPLMLHEIVSVRGWLDSKTFMDGIALGQITPGPIVITATFVGYLLYGFVGAVLSTIAVFTPSFLILIGITPFFVSAG